MYDKSHELRSLRQDGQRCYTAIISTCRTIKEEACDVLYGSVEYELEVDGESVYACLFWARTLSWPCRTMMDLEQTAARLRCARPSFLSYVRKLRLKINAYSKHWGSVSRSASRKEVSGVSLSYIFTVFDTRSTLELVLNILTGLPLLDNVNVCILYANSYQHRATPAEIEWLLEPFSQVRSEHLKFENIEPNDAQMEDRAFRHFKSALRHQGGQIEQKLVTAMRGAEPPDGLTYQYDNLEQLKTFVFQFRNEKIFVVMCRILFDAMDKETSGSHRSFLELQEELIWVWERERQRLRRLIDRPGALLADLERLEPETSTETQASGDLGDGELQEAISSDESEYGRKRKKGKAKQKAHKLVGPRPLQSPSPEPPPVSNQQSTRSGRVIKRPTRL